MPPGFISLCVIEHTKSPDKFAAMWTSTTPESGFGFPNAKMERTAPGTFCLPLRRLFNSERNHWLTCWIAHIVKQQCFPGGTSTSVAIQSLRAFVFVVRLVADVAGCLPVAWHDDRFFACITGTRDCSESLGHRFPYRAMASFRTCKSMSDFMQQCIQHLFGGIVTRVVLGNLNPSITKFAYTLLTFRVRQSKHPVVQAMLHEFPLSNGFQFPQIHTYVPVNRATSISRTSPIRIQMRCFRRGSEPGIFLNSWCKHLNRNATPARTCLPLVPA